MRPTAKKKPCRPSGGRQGLQYEGQEVPEALFAHQALSGAARFAGDFQEEGALGELGEV